MALKRVAETRPLVQRVKCQRVGGRGSCSEALGVTSSGAGSSADLGGSSKYSNVNFED